MTFYAEDGYREVMDAALTTMDKYLDYATSMPTRDGKEIRDFLNDITEGDTK